MGLERKKQIAILLNEEIHEIMAKEGIEEDLQKALDGKIHQIKSDTDEYRIMREVLKCATILDQHSAIAAAAKMSEQKVDKSPVEPIDGD